MMPHLYDMTYSDMLDAIADERAQLSSALLQVMQDEERLQQRKNVQVYASRLSSLAEATDNPALISLCTVWQQNLQELCEQDSLLQSFDPRFIKSSDEALQQHLVEPDKYSLLLDALQDKQWPSPLSEEQAQDYKKQFDADLIKYQVDGLIQKEAETDLPLGDENEGFFGSVNDEVSAAGDPTFSLALDELFSDVESDSSVPQSDNIVVETADVGFFDLPVEQVSTELGETIGVAAPLETTEDGFFDLEAQGDNKTAEEDKQNNTIESPSEGFFGSVDDALQTSEQAFPWVHNEQINELFSEAEIDHSPQQNDSVIDDGFFDLDAPEENKSAEKDEQNNVIDLSDGGFSAMPAGEAETSIETELGEIEFSEESMDDDFFDIKQESETPVQKHPDKFGSEELTENLSEDEFFDVVSDGIQATDQDEHFLATIVGIIENSDISVQGIDVPLLEMIASEMQNILSELNEEFNDLETDIEQQKQTLEHYSGTLGHLVSATETVNLQGLNYFFQVMIWQANKFSQCQQLINTDEQQSLIVWFPLLAAYMQSINDYEAAKLFADTLHSPSLPEALSETAVNKLVDWLISPVLTTTQEEAKDRKTEAFAEDVLLSLPEDVNPELLDTLLQELPVLSADFSSAIHNLDAGGNQEDVRVACRVAHTLKGAANTVGIRGIAVLTHQIEDILDVFAHQSALPNSDLAEVLSEAADCLEGMCEAIAGQSEAPEEALPVLQKILDWANLIIKEGIPESQQVPESKEVVTSVPEKSERRAATSNLSRLSSTLVDNLFRLSSENLVLTGQLHNRLDLARDEARLLREQNRGLQQLVADLDRLGNIQGLSATHFKQQEGEFDSLEMDQYTELHSITARLMESVADANELSEGLGRQLTQLDTLMASQSRLLVENQDAVLHTRMTPLSSIASRCQRAVRQASRLTNKQVELILQGEDTLIDSEVLTALVDPLMHLLRNAVDHGIESSEVRKSLGKPASGTVILSFSRQGNQIVISCQDDGSGLDVEAIRDTAIKHNVIQQDQVLTEQEIARLILAPGFSTRTSATQVSGRGVGMDAVYTQLQKLKGRLSISFEVGQGSQFDLALPAALTSTHALIVSSGLQQIAVSSRGIEQIFYADTGKLRRTANNLSYYVNEEVYPAIYMETLLNQPLSEEDVAQERPVLLVKDETGAGYIVLVQQVFSSQEIVVKKLGEYLPDINGLVGASILGDGRIAPVVDLQDLVFSNIEYAAVQTVSDQGQGEKGLPEALIIDDSLSARRSLAQFLGDAGYATRTAIDGIDAIEMLESKKPDIVLVDMEMPRMNGLEFTVHLRANPRTQHIPVIMITSRGTVKHKQQAQQAGVNEYVTKPFSEDDLLVQVETLLRNR
ncbi:MAG: response regulator [Methyloprofundus sp.]|nr:response regulator [Methyloprofundus sp.]